MTACTREHQLYAPEDFRDEQGEPSRLAILVCEGGLAICKICGKGESQLNDSPECPGENKQK